MRSSTYLILLGVVIAGVAHASNPQGSWQGTISSPDQGLDHERYVFRISREADNRWTASIVIDEDWGMPWRATTVSVDGRAIEIAVPALGSTYDGVLSKDGRSLSGIWIIGTSRFPLHLVRPTSATLWREAPHKTLFVTVQDNIRVEVLDWGGTGRALVLLAGAGNSAHIFSRLAPRLTTLYHVYGITRRGFGASSVPVISRVPASSITVLGPNSFALRPFPNNPYDADRLGNDVVAVLDSLHLMQPVLLGHSIAGEELSSVATRYPHRIAGLIYIDALQEYAFADGKSLDALFTAQHPLICRPGTYLSVTCPLPQGMDPHRADRDEAMMLGMHIFNHLPSIPALAIFALPHHLPVNVKTAAEISGFNAFQLRQLARVHRIASLLPTFQIKNIPYASHEIWETNESQVITDINSFIASLPVR